MSSCDNQGKLLLNPSGFEADTFERWRRIGVDKGLTTDWQIARFLVEQYENNQRSQPRCVKCNGPLALLCNQCDFAGWPTQSPDIVSFSTPHSVEHDSPEDAVGMELFTMDSDCQGIDTSAVPCSSPSFRAVEQHDDSTVSHEPPSFLSAFNDIKVEAEENTEVSMHSGFEDENNVTTDRPSREAQSSRSEDSSGSRRKRKYVQRKQPDNSEQQNHKVSDTCDKSKSLTLTVRVNPLSLTAPSTRLRGVCREAKRVKRKNKLKTVKQSTLQCDPCHVMLNSCSPTTASTQLSGGCDGASWMNLRESPLSVLFPSGKERRKGELNRSKNLNQSVQECISSREAFSHSNGIVNQSSVPDLATVEDSESMNETENQHYTGGTSQSDEGEEVTVQFPDPYNTDMKEVQSSDSGKTTKRRRNRSSLKKTVRTAKRSIQRSMDENFQNCEKSADNSSGGAGAKRGKKQLLKQKPTCEVCGATFTQSHNLKLHIMREHTGERPFVCEVCGKSYVRAAELARHSLQRHSSHRPYQCDQCDAAFAVKTSLTSHLLIHTGQKSNICHICGAEFLHKVTLNHHMRVHNKEKPHKCPECEMAFTQRGNMLIHMRRHTGDKPYQCTECGTRFRASGTLKTHMMVHTGEKPFSCVDCGKSFITSSTLKVHRRSHTGDRPYTCSVCSSAFITSYALSRHMLIHTGQRPYKCPHCAFAFARSHHLKAHMQRKHTAPPRAAEPVKLCTSGTMFD